VASKIWKYSRAIPQYNLRHGHIVSTIRAEGRGQAGLFFAGNYLEGPAIGKCIDNGLRTAEAVTAYLNRL
jgi:protoporphyrinogen oxidase